MSSSYQLPLEEPPFYRSRKLIKSWLNQCICFFSSNFYSIILFLFAILTLSTAILLTFLKSYSLLLKSSFKIFSTWFIFLGAYKAYEQSNLVGLNTISYLKNGSIRTILAFLNRITWIFVCLFLIYGTSQSIAKNLLPKIEFSPFPDWLSHSIFPICFALMALQATSPFSNQNPSVCLINNKKRIFQNISKLLIGIAIIGTIWLSFIHPEKSSSGSVHFLHWVDEIFSYLRFLPHSWQKLAISIDKLFHNKGYPVFHFVVNHEISPGFFILMLLFFIAFLAGTPIFGIITGICITYFYFLYNKPDQFPITEVTLPIQNIILQEKIHTLSLVILLGAFIAATRSSERLFSFFNAIAGWTKGGLALMVLLLCALFTTLTGGSGITIVAVGGFFLHRLVQHGYPVHFCIGLITAGSSLGLLFKPSLPMILYQVVAAPQVSSYYTENLQLQILTLPDLFQGAFLPGIFLIFLISIYCFFISQRYQIPQTPFSWKNLYRTFWEVKWELLIPLVFLICHRIYTDYIHSIATVCLYVFGVNLFIHREIKNFNQILKIIINAGTLAGSIILIFCVGLVLSNLLSTWNIHEKIQDLLIKPNGDFVISKTTFLLLLNLFLLLLGSILELFSAIFLLPMLIIPLGALYKIHPIHLSVLFLANMEVGFLMPPIGLNLFLAAISYKKPLHSIYRYTFPFFIILLLGILLITFFEPLSTYLLKH